jgi:hypothetical protein
VLAAGATVLVELDDVLLELAEEDEVELSLKELCLAWLYPSLYHPPPLKEMAAAEMTRVSSPPQCGHCVISGSENF